MIVLGIIFIIVSLLMFIIMCIASSEIKDISDGFFFGWLAGLMFLLGINAIIEGNEMTPMDVYQGKTTLEYKVKDGVVVDSIVVWKNK